MIYLLLFIFGFLGILLVSFVKKLNHEKNYFLHYETVKMIFLSVWILVNLNFFQSGKANPCFVILSGASGLLLARLLIKKCKWFPDFLNTMG